MPFSVFLEHFLPRAHVKVLGKFDVLGVSVILEKKSSERMQCKRKLLPPNQNARLLQVMHISAGLPVGCVLIILYLYIIRISLPPDISKENTVPFICLHVVAHS